jgi:ornithine cyclodeaminase
MKILNRQQIEQALSIPEAFKAIERGFAAYSSGQAVIPPVATLHFDRPPGDCHIKYGYAKEGKYYVVKIASGFPENPKSGIPSSNGLMLLFDIDSGKPLAALLDEGYLTDVRTGLAGAIAAKYLAPKDVACVGIVGTGAQAYYQLKLLSYATPCRKAMIWGRDEAKARSFAANPDLREWSIETAKSIDELADRCRLIVTATSSDKPIIQARHLRPGTHITAVGADDAGKQELDPEIFVQADRVVVDSRSQCMQFGDASYAIKSGLIRPEKLIEIGEVVAEPSLGRVSDNQVSVADLTGVAIQDLQIAASVYEAALP